MDIVNHLKNNQWPIVGLDPDVYLRGKDIFLGVLSLQSKIEMQCQTVYD